MERKNTILGIVLGFVATFLLHAIAIGLVFATIAILSSAGVFANAYTALKIWIAIVRWFFLLQLIYILPAILILKRRKNVAMANGTIIGAVVTALLNGGVHLLMSDMLSFG